MLSAENKALIERECSPIEQSWAIEHSLFLNRLLNAARTEGLSQGEGEIRLRAEVTVRGTVVELSREHPEHSWVRFTMDPLKVQFGRYVLLPNSLLAASPAHPPPVGTGCREKGPAEEAGPGSVKP